jgi:hypothetical protein
VAASTTTTVAARPTCDAGASHTCLLPWPDDSFTNADPTTPTGRRLAIPQGLAPANARGVRVDVTDQNRADGFSPGSTILVEAPGVDVVASHLPPSTDIGASFEAPATLALAITDVASGEVWPYWAEVDAQTPSSGLLLVHPATALREAHTYHVHVGTLLDRDGHAVDTPLRDWSFTVASAASLAGRMLHVRDDALRRLGQLPPTFRVDQVHDDGGVRTVDGVLEVPNYLTGTGAPGSRFSLGADGLPQANADHPTFDAAFQCVLPTAPPAAVPVVVYGHGLLGSRQEVGALRFAAQLGVAGACATDEIGMASDDIPNLATILGDMSHFPEQADRMQQGILDQLFLGRAINDEQAFATSSAFDDGAGHPLIAPGRTVFVGNSQGGILGGAVSSVSTEWTNVVLGVPGIDYGLLLDRSSDWPQLATLLDAGYPDPVDRKVVLQLAQLLWDRGENDGYAQHLTADPYPGIATKNVLLIEAFGDHQVANVATEMLARTIDAKVHQPALAGGRSPAVTPFWGIAPIDNDPSPGPALVMWDYGNPPPPAVNLAPTEPAYGQDPHGAGSREPKVLQMALGFLLSGKVDTSSCAGPCVSTVLTGG